MQKMKKKKHEDPWEKQRLEIITEIRCGKIQTDNNIYPVTLADTGDIILTRGDFIPMSTKIIELNLKEIGVDTSAEGPLEEKFL